MLKEIELPTNLELEPLHDPTRVSGFISPAEDYKSLRLHIAQRIVTDPVNTHYFQTDNNEMHYFGIYKDSIIVVDRSVEIKVSKIIVCNFNGEWLIRKLCKRDKAYYLCINDNMEGCIPVASGKVDYFGVVTWACLPFTS